MIVERFLINETQAGCLIVKLQSKEFVLGKVSGNELEFLDARIYISKSLYTETKANSFALCVTFLSLKKNVWKNIVLKMMRNKIGHCRK